MRVIKMTKKPLTSKQKQQYDATVAGNHVAIMILERQEDLECFDLQKDDFSIYSATIEEY
jgi:hypothetical protein